MIATSLVLLARLLTGVRGHWHAEKPQGQAIYYANHASHLDFVLLWASLPPDLRQRARPVAAADFWADGGVRQKFAEEVFRAVLIERMKVTAESNPLTPMLAVLKIGDSLVIFPEGTRSQDGEIRNFKSGLFHIAREFPGAALIPVYIDNLNRVLPKGEILPVPLLCSVHFGPALPRMEAEGKAAFLERAREAVLQLRQE